MPRLSRTLRVLAPLLAAGALGACSTAQLALPDGLAAAESLPVQGRQGWKLQERISFGDYQSAEVQRSWTRGSDGRLGGTDVSAVSRRRAQEFSFRLLEGGTPRWAAACQAELRSAGLDVAGVEVRPLDRSGVQCELRPIGGGAAWRLSLAESGERPMSGTLEGGDRTFQVRGTDRVAGGMLPAPGTTGYHLLGGDGRARGAVQTMNDGTVWLDRDLAADERSVLAATATALLLIEELRGTLEQGR